MTIIFQKYPKLTNHYALASEALLVENLETIFYETEKIHGANISFIFNRDLEYVVASRNRIISNESDQKQFAGALVFAEENLDLLKEVATKIFELKTEAIQVHLCGELYGKGIQKMEYDEIKNNIKTVRFFNFITLNKDETKTKLAFNLMKELLPDSLIAPIGKVDTLRNLVTRTDEEIQDSKLGGYSEGSVYQYPGEYVIGRTFLGVKHKTAQFAEKTRDKSATKKAKVEYTAEEIEALGEVNSRVTIQRISNVLSHGGLELKSENFGQIIKAVQADILEEVLREVPTTNEKVVKFAVNKTAKSIVSLLQLKMKESIS